MRRSSVKTWLLALFLFALPLAADFPPAARSYSVYSSDKTIRVHSIPKGTFGNKGKTEVFDVQRMFKKRLYRFDWYAWDLHVYEKRGARQNPPGHVPTIRESGLEKKQRARGRVSRPLSPVRLRRLSPPLARFTGKTGSDLLGSGTAVRCDLAGIPWRSLRS